MPTLQVRLAERDYVKAAQAAARPSTRTVTVFAILSALVGLGIIVGWYAGYIREVFIFGFVWFGGMIGGWLGNALSIAPKAKRVFRQQKGLGRAYEVSWDTVGLRVVGEDGESTTRWSDFYKHRELDELFVLFFSDAVFLMLPKRSFPDSGLLRDFRELVTESVPGQ